jgi:hypothetical protein
MLLHFRTIIFCLFLLAISPAFGLDGYVFVAPGGSTVAGRTNGTLHVGGGVEKVFSRGIGVGGEIGALGPWNNFRSAIGMASVNGSYHFIPRAQKFDPFVTGGYTLGFRSGTLNFGNFGGGLNYWFGERLGLRTEFRDHVHVSDRVPNLHYWGIRVGLAFR